ncbi:MAG TPA: N-acetyltransferase [Thermoanaerobaculia bacterium]|nr:N-acetyltransferase [Thermoanaerobaculia bacterium]
MEIRPEQPEDVPAVHQVNSAAFGREEEARLVDLLWEAGAVVASLVAVDKVGDAGEVVGHILFSPVTLDGCDRSIAGLAPMAVLPGRQRDGIGSALVERGLAACRDAGIEAVVVLGHPEYYPRFGFVPASRFGLGCEYPVPDEVFMALELTPGALAGCRGTVRYRPEFSQVE